MASRSHALLPPSAAFPAVHPSRGAVLAVVTVLCWASAFPAIRIAVRGFGPLEVAFLRAAAATLAQFALAGAGPRCAVLFLGVVPTAVGYWTWAGANRHLPASVAGSFLYLVPPVALLLGWAALGEVPTFLSLAGGALVVGGVAMVQRLGRQPGLRDPPDRSWRRALPSADARASRSVG